MTCSVCTYCVYPRKDELADDGEHLPLGETGLGQEVGNEVPVFPVNGGALVDPPKGLSGVLHGNSTQQ